MTPKLGVVVAVQPQHKTKSGQLIAGTVTVREIVNEREMHTFVDGSINAAPPELHFTRAMCKIEWRQSAGFNLPFVTRVPAKGRPRLVRGQKA